MMRVTHRLRPAGPLSLIAVFRLALVAVILAAGSRHARAQLIDQVDVVARNGDSEITIRFGTTVQYLHHQPANGSNLLQIAFRLTGDRISADSRLVSELRRHPGSKLLPPFEVAYDQRSGYMNVRFGRHTQYRVGPGADPRSIRITVPGPKKAADAAPGKTPFPGKPAAAAKADAVPPASAQKPAAPIPPAAAAIAPADIELQAMDSLAQAKLALKEKRAVAAIDLLNRVLNLPPTSAAQEAQELIGNARELNGEMAKARAEYELYLKLYPAAPGAARVKQRLATLGTSLPANRADSVKNGTGKSEYSYFGSVSSYYYRGSTKYDATLAPPLPGLNFDQVSLTGTDQSSIVTNIDLNARLRRGNWDHKLVFRDTNSASFLDTQPSYNRVNNAYIESFNKSADFFARAGRQSSPGYGVLSRFDGAWLRYGFNARAKFNVIAGVPVEFYPAPKKQFLGAAFDLGPFADRWSGNVFFIGQQVAGFVDRRAIGTEIRYLDPQKNAFALVDYDTSAKVMNIALLQGNWQIRDGTSLNLLYDRRRSPALQLTNSLYALPLPTVRENIDSGITVDELRDVARVVTPVATLFSVGVTQQLGPAWQLSGDVKYSEVSGTNAIGTQVAQEGSGKIMVYGLQVIRTGFLTVNDILVATTNILRGKSYNGELYQLSHVLLYQEKWRVESTFKYYHQVDAGQNVLERFSPSIRASYRWFDRLNLEAEVGAEKSTSKGPLQSDKTLRKFYNFGMRYDFF